MVGVPGQSKGCNTCRKRKKGCDLQRPKCGQCIKGSLECGGYERERIFVNQGFSTQKKRGLAKANNRDSPRPMVPASTVSESHHESIVRQVDSDDPWFSESSSSPETVVSSQFYFDYSESEFSAPVHHSRVGDSSYMNLSSSLAERELAPVIVTPSLAPVFQAQFLALFCNTWLPSTIVGPTFSWIETLPHLSITDPSLQATCAAVSTARVGQVIGDARLEKESLRLYGRGLRRLQEALWDEERMYSDETLASALILALYEILECKRDKGYAWMSHTKGGARLVKLRGPGMHRGTLSHELFRGIRGTAVIDGISARKATFLAEDEWLSLPFEGFQKSSLDKLYDIMVHISGMLEEADSSAVETRTQKQLSRRLSLISRCWILHEKLAAWYADLVATNDGPLYWYEPTSRANPPSFFMPPKTYMHFPSLLIANSLCLYWASLELIYGTMFHLYGSLPPSFDKSFLRILDNEGAQDVRKFAMSIMQSAEYFMKPEMGGSAVAMMLFPLRCAMQFFIYFPGKEEAQWCLEVFAEFEERGVPFGTFLATQKLEQWPTERKHFVPVHNVFSDGKGSYVGNR